MSDETRYVPDGNGGMLGIMPGGLIAGGKWVNAIQTRDVVEELRHRQGVASSNIEDLTSKLADAEIEYERCTVALAALSPPTSSPVPDEVRSATPAAEESAGGQMPEGFTAWPGEYVGFATPPLGSRDIVECWMGADDFVGPLEVRDMDWNHATDPVRGYRIVAQAPPTDQAAAEPLPTALQSRLDADEQPEDETPEYFNEEDEL